MTRIEAMKAVIAALQAEIAAMKAFDVDALVAATAAKQDGLVTLAANDDGVDAELEALAHEAAALNETARVYVNLMASSVQNRIEALTGKTRHSYGPGRRIAV
jgi:cell division protein FtsB